MNRCSCKCSHASRSISAASNLTIKGTPRLVSLHKSGGSGQISPIMAVDIAVQAGASGQIAVQYNAPRPSIPPGGSHCSDVRVTFSVTGQAFYQSGWLGYEGRKPALPLYTDLVVVTGLTEGTHVLTVQPEGRVGGCNNGRLFSWDGTLLVFE